MAVSGTTANGTVIATIAAGVAPDAAGNANAASTSTDNSVTSNAFDTDAPTVTITPAAGQQNPAPGNVINFTVTFSEPVTGFTSSDVVIGGTSGATTATVTGGPTVYNVAVTGMTTNGTVTISLAAGVVTDTAGNPNTASGAIAGIVFSGVPVIVPTLSTFGLLAMLLAMLAVGFWMHRRNDAFRA